MAGPGGILLNTLAGAERTTAALTPGQVVRAVVSGQSGDSVSLRIGGQVVEARLAALLAQNPSTQLTPGSVLRFSVETGTDGLLLRLLSTGATASQPANRPAGGAVPATGTPPAAAPATPTGAAGTGQADTAQQQPAAAPSTSARPAPATVSPQAAGQAATATAARPAAPVAGGPGPQTPAAPPGPVPAPGQTPPQSADRPVAIRDATAQSAPRQSAPAQLVSRLGSIDSLSALIGASRTTPTEAALPTVPASASPAQGATANAPAATPSGTLPGLDTLATRLLGLRLSSNPQTGEISATALREAVQRNGPFLEAMLAAGRPEASGAAKAQFSGLISLLGQLLGGRGRGGAQPAHAPAPPPSGTPPQNTAQPSAPPIPQQGGALKPQAPVPLPDLSGNPAELLQRLAQDAEGALHRARLLQIASLPDGEYRGGGAEKPTEWHIDIPLRHGDRDTTLGLMISRHGTGRDAEAGDDATWRVRLAVELDDAGPIHALIHLAGGRVQVGLWAEKDRTARRLKRDQDALRDLLQSNALDVQEISIDQGQPPPPGQVPPASGILIDQTS